MRGTANGESVGGNGVRAALATISRVGRSWPDIAESERPAAFAAAIDAVEAVEWLPTEQQHHLLDAKLALWAGTAEGLTDDQRRAALSDAAERLARVTPTATSPS